MIFFYSNFIRVSLLFSWSLSLLSLLYTFEDFYYTRQVRLQKYTKNVYSKLSFKVKIVFSILSALLFSIIIHFSCCCCCFIFISGYIVCTRVNWIFFFFFSKKSKTFSFSFEILSVNAVCFGRSREILCIICLKKSF